MTERATLGFHGGWIDDNMGKRPTSAEGTRCYLNSIHRQSVAGLIIMVVLALA